MFISDSWDNVMDARYNPLRFIRDPSLQAYFTLVLFLMWSVYFGFVASYYLGLANFSTVTSIFVHVAVLLPIMVTNAVFRDAERDGEEWLQIWREQKRAYNFWKSQVQRKNENVCKWDLQREG
jgi:hypothetical protein